MAVSRQVDLLEPINLADHLGKVELYLGQVCQIAGISKMQLDYWTNKAQIPTKGKKQRIYDIEALETVMLIKQAKDKGLNLGAAIEARALSAQSSASSRAGSETRLAVAPAGQSPASASARLAAAASSGATRVHVDAGAELDAGEDGQPRHDLEVPAVAVCSHAFSGTGRRRRAQPADELGAGAAAPRRGARSPRRPARDRRARSAPRTERAPARGQHGDHAVALERRARRRATSSRSVARPPAAARAARRAASASAARLAPAALPSLTSACR